ncbi:hypothetical protein KP509_01G127400 [Ceratopteris richardii]|uniref:Pentatricopeptide repeat-containing protein n=1 Tax=Ceratopteris richardii TaxID=49495 RepID=A0A8T2VU62_CERRI|nr:hypothetical protein KP509_01G127400 [Ceratopteris richardii]
MMVSWPDAALYGGFQQGDRPSVDFKSAMETSDRRQPSEPVFLDRSDGMTTEPSPVGQWSVKQFPAVMTEDCSSLSKGDAAVKAHNDMDTTSQTPNGTYGSHDKKEQLVLDGKAMSLISAKRKALLYDIIDLESCNAITVKERLLMLIQEEEIPSIQSIISIIQKCRESRHQMLAKFLHQFICFTGLDNLGDVGNDLVGALLECKITDLAQQVFSKLEVRTEFPWTYFIREYTEHGQVELAVSMFKQMKEDRVAASKFTYVALLKACTKIKSLVEGQIIHSEILKVGLENDYYIGNVLLDLYAKCGSLPEVQNVFERLRVQDVVSWTSLISGYVEKGLDKDAVHCFEQMVEKGTFPDERVFTCVLKACRSIGTREKGLEVHAFLVTEELENDLIIGNSLIDMYVKCGLLLEAKDVFDSMLVKDVVSWTTLISGFAENGLSEAAILMYTSMLEQGLIPNDNTFATTLKACMIMPDREPGRRLHAQIQAMSCIRSLDAFAVTALIEMYAKWGCMEDAQQVFETMKERDLICWNALITGYSEQGEYGAVFQLLDRMKQEGIPPDEVTYLCALTACSRGDLLDKGKLYFNALLEDRGTTVTIKHYNCMVDLLGNAGYLKEALNMLKSMPFPPDLVAWITLLASCQKWGNVEIGRQAFEAILKLDETHVSAFHAMFNIYVDANMWEEAKKIEVMRLNMEAGKTRPRSSIEVDGLTHVFVVGDRPPSSFNNMWEA